MITKFSLFESKETSIEQLDHIKDIFQELEYNFDCVIKYNLDYTNYHVYISDIKESSLTTYIEFAELCQSLINKAIEMFGYELPGHQNSYLDKWSSTSIKLCGIIKDTELAVTHGYEPGLIENKFLYPLDNGIFIWLNPNDIGNFYIDRVSLSFRAPRDHKKKIIF